MSDPAPRKSVSGLAGPLPRYDPRAGDFDIREAGEWKIYDGTQWVPYPSKPKDPPIPFWISVLLVAVLILSMCLNIAQAYHRHLFENQWRDCPSRIVYDGICVPENPATPGGTQVGA